DHGRRGCSDCPCNQSGATGKRLRKPYSASVVVVLADSAVSREAFTPLRLPAATPLLRNEAVQLHFPLESGSRQGCGGREPQGRGGLPRNGRICQNDTTEAL